MAPSQPDLLAEIVEAVSPLIHDGRKIDAANRCLELAGLNSRVDTEPDGVKQLATLLRNCLANRRLDLAAKLLWPASMFTTEPRSVNLVWSNVAEHPFVLLPGASSMGKSYTPGVYLYLEWLSDPEYTQVVTVGPSEEHLESNLFTHLVTLHRGAALPVPGVVNKLFIGLDPRERKSSISGRVIPIGSGKAAGRLQGMKRNPRPKPHPVFGKMSRLFLLIDELENVPPGVYSDLENLVSNYTEGDAGFKIIGSYNPKDRSLPPGRLSEPPQGWEEFDVDLDEVWTSKAGYRVVRLDAEKTENVQQRRTIFPGLQSYSALQKLAEASGGFDSPGYYTFGRGAYPQKGGSVPTVVQQGSLDSRRGELVFVDRPTPVGGIDLALDGGDKCKFARGLFGRASGVRTRDAAGKLVFTKFPASRYALQLCDVFVVPKGDSVEMAASVREACLRHHIRPDALAVDKTGHTRGVSDILIRTLGPHTAVNNSESPTGTRITEDDDQLPAERFDRIASELWFATKDWIEYDCLYLLPEFDASEVCAQLYGRRYKAGKRDKVEEKKHFKLRNRGLSPDDADAVTLLVHAVRVRWGAVLSGIRGSKKASAWTSESRSSQLDGDRDAGYTDPTNDVNSDNLF